MLGDSSAPLKGAVLFLNQVVTRHSGLIRMESVHKHVNNDGATGTAPKRLLGKD